VAEQIHHHGHAKKELKWEENENKELTWGSNIDERRDADVLRRVAGALVAPPPPPSQRRPSLLLHLRLARLRPRPSPLVVAGADPPRADPSSTAPGTSSRHRHGSAPREPVASRRRRSGSTPRRPVSGRARRHQSPPPWIRPARSRLCLLPPHLHPPPPTPPPESASQAVVTPCGHLHRSGCPLLLRPVPPDAPPREKEEGGGLDERRQEAAKRDWGRRGEEQVGIGGGAEACDWGVVADLGFSPCDLTRIGSAHEREPMAVSTYRSRK
jgi:hypothetical protein